MNLEDLQKPQAPVQCVPIIFPAVKRSESGVDFPTPFIAEVKEREKLKNLEGIVIILLVTCQQMTYIIITY
jgi:hypothetical protein